MRIALFWAFTQGVVVIPYRRFGKLIGPFFKRQETLEDGTDRLSRNVGKELSLHAA